MQGKIFIGYLVGLSLVLAGLVSCQSAGASGQDSAFGGNKINMKMKNDIGTYFDFLKSDQEAALKYAVVTEQNLQQGWIDYKLSLPVPKIFVPAKKQLKLTRQFGRLKLFRAMDKDFVVQMDHKCTEACEQKLTFRQFNYEGNFKKVTLGELLSSEAKVSLNQEYQKCIGEGAQVAGPFSVGCPWWLQLSKENQSLMVFETQSGLTKEGETLKQKFILQWENSSFIMVPANKSVVWSEAKY